VDNSVQIQGLPGRMSGYWRDCIQGGHKTGPHRTSIKAIEEYEKTYLDPYGTNSYQTAGFKKKKGNVSAAPTMLSPRNIPNLDATELPEVDVHSEYDITEPYNERDEVEKYISPVLKTGKIAKYINTESSIQYRGIKTSLYVYENKKQFKKKDIYAGINKEVTSNSIVCRIMPIMVNGSTKWIGIYLKSAVKNMASAS
jgi:hypothetical protein